MAAMVEHSQPEDMCYLYYSANVPASYRREAQSVADALNDLLHDPVADWHLTIAEPEDAEYWEVVLRGEHAGKPFIFSGKFHGPDRAADLVINYLRGGLAGAGVLHARGAS